jgi:hypothetical protein
MRLTGPGTERDARAALGLQLRLDASRCRSSPRVEASSFGDAAVLAGGLAMGLRAARENVLVNRA